MVINMALTDLLFAGVLAFAASLTFPLTIAWRAGLLLPVILLLSLVLKKQRQQAKARDVLHDYQTLLAYLSSRLSIGETLERALWTSPKAIQSQVGVDSRFSKGLLQIARQIDSHSDLGNAIRAFVSQLPCASVQPILLVLPILQKTGGRLDQFVRDSHRMLSEMAALEQEIRAEQSQKQAEALILSLMPFVLSVGLQQMINGDDQSNLIHNALSQLVYGGSYLLACLALALTWMSRQSGQIDRKQPRAKPQRRSSRINDLDSRLAKLLLAFYEHPIIVRLSKPICVILADNPPSREQYFLVKLRIMVLGLTLALLWILWGAIPFYLLPTGPVGACLLQDASLLRRQRNRTNRYRLEYPLFLNWQANLLQTGISTTHSMQAGLAAWADQDPNSVVGEDLKFFQQQSLGVRTCDWIVERLADRNPVPELQVYWHNVARYEREGSHELLELLSLQAKTGYQLLSFGRRRELEEKSLLVLVPMIIDLLVVLVIAIWPSALILIQS
jgi:Flp pilus assembly protein TadB